jgi:hypothetical protein
MFARHETLQVVMLRHLTKDGTVSIKLIDARSIGMFHDGQSQTALEEQPESSNGFLMYTLNLT